MTHTHTGNRHHTGYMHAGPAFRQRIPNSGKRHALNGGPDIYVALCGETVEPRTHWPDGEPVREDESPTNIDTVAECSLVTCARCKRLIAAAKRKAVETISDDILPQRVIDGVLAPKTLDAQGRIVSDGPWNGITPDEVLADRDAFNRACGE